MIGATSANGRVDCTIAADECLGSPSELLLERRRGNR
jgi:hypothetical protein